MLIRRIDIVLQSFPQWRNPLRLAVGVPAILNRLAQGVFDRLRRIKVWLTDAQIDRIFHRGRKVKNLSDPRCIDLMHAICNPILTHIHIVFF
jgi:hypothetical protein